MKFKKKFMKTLAISMAFSMIFSTNAFATPIDLANSEMDVKTDTLDKSTGTDYFADEENEWLDGTINEEVRVTVDLASQFEITIPKEIVLNGEDGTAQYKVKAVGDIAGDQKLLVVPEPDFVLSEAGGKADVTAIVTQTNAEYVYTDLQGDGTEYDGNIIATLTAGEWSGKFNFNISFEGETTQSLYLLEYTTVNEGPSTYSYIEEENTEITKFKTLDELKAFTSNNTELKTVVLTMNTNEDTEEQDLSNLFENDVNLTDVDLTNLDVEKVLDVSNMFSGSNNISKIYIKHELTQKFNNLKAKLGVEDLTIVDATDVTHNYNEVITKATCIEDGYTTYTCLDCGYSYKDNEISAIGHNYSSEITLKPTCTEKGVETYTCSNCNDEYTKDIDAIGHTEVNGGTQTVHKKCSICDVTLSTTHSLTSIITKEATCTETGTRKYTCDCGYTYDENIAATGHSYSCSLEDDSYHVCANCNSTEGHTLVENPNIGTAGGQECKYCGFQIVKVPAFPWY